MLLTIFKTGDTVSSRDDDFQVKVYIAPAQEFRIGSIPLFTADT